MFFLSSSPLGSLSERLDQPWSEAQCSRTTSESPLSQSSVKEFYFWQQSFDLLFDRGRTRPSCSSLSSSWRFSSSWNNNGRAHPISPFLPGSDSVTAGQTVNYRLNYLTSRLWHLTGRVVLLKVPWRHDVMPKYLGESSDLSVIYTLEIRGELISSFSRQGKRQSFYLFATFDSYRFFLYYQRSK